MFNLRSLIIEIVTDALLIALPGDIFYLYLVGRWQEPILFILAVELVILPAIMVLGVWRVVRFVRGNHMARDVNVSHGNHELEKPFR